MFTLGVRTGLKGPAAKNESSERLFTRTEWLTKTQVQGFFSRLAAKHRKGQGAIDLSPDQDEDVQCLQEYSDRQDLLDMVNEEINVSHPICYDTYDLCERYLNNPLKEFIVAMLKTICSYFEIPVKSRVRQEASSHRQTTGYDQKMRVCFPLVLGEGVSRAAVPDSSFQLLRRLQFRHVTSL